MWTYIALAASFACLQAASAKSLFEPHIAGGGPVAPHSLPHQVALLHPDGTFFCGGSLISDRWVVTAGHCAHQKSSIYVDAGVHNLTASEHTSFMVPTQKIVVHPLYQKGPMRNDIALLYLEKSLDPYIMDGKFIKPIRLPKMSDKDKSYWKSPVTMSGWGRIEDRISENSDVLKSLNTTVLWNLTCKYRLFRNFNSYDQICTDGTGHVGACFGDSGGPLTQTEEDGKPTLIGIASYIADGFDCMNGGPTAFTRVATFLDWITKTTENKIAIRP